MQGGLGDCWMVSAMSILGCNEELLKKVCVIRDEEVGIYGFVFYRGMCVSQSRSYLTNCLQMVNGIRPSLTTSYT